MKEYIIDSHCHLDDEKFDGDRDQIIENLDKNRVLAVVNAAVDLENSKRVIDLANRHDKIYAMLGNHPHEAKYYDAKTRQEYIELARNNKKLVAVGEIGLDYHYDNSPRDIQKKVFIDQIKLARQLDLPIVIHSRDAVEDTIDILAEYAQGMKVLLHAFSEHWQVAIRYLGMGFDLALGGVVTFKNANKLLEVGEKVPLDRLHLETDAPYLTPHPLRGRRNEPAYAHYVAEKIGQLKNIDPDEVRKASRQNTIEFFGLDL